jgi:excisionase family DNA binding protein
MARQSAETPLFYTTHQVAGFLGVSLPTVVNWIEAGRFPAHRTPGGHRRIAHGDLVAFAEAHHIPLSGLRKAAAPGPNRILVVDDEVEFAQLVADFLTMKGYEVATAESGFTGGLALARFRPDLLVVDLMMPDIDGFAVLQTIRSNRETRELPVIACTGWRDDDLGRRLDEAGFDGVIEKPVKLEHLAELIAGRLRSAG